MKFMERERKKKNQWTLLDDAALKKLKHLPLPGCDYGSNLQKTTEKENGWRDPCLKGSFPNGGTISQRKSYREQVLPSQSIMEHGSRNFYAL